ncbi:hypothetical protein [Clostridium celatum]|uniref:hypothetical protein n=1 Tax=Clostridium celatum TaxID=36834 RepID=UPI001A9C1653|nr:hypothetical protein [Clostridium celatum]
MCFLRDQEQYLLRHSSMTRSDRFEHALELYSDEFINSFKINKNLLCDVHKNNNNQLILDALQEINIDEVTNFFTHIRKIYFYWINASLSTSLEYCKSLLTEYKLLNFTNTLENELVFRCRPSESFISHWDMFHIPFNKRFLIGNQRYSLTGQPLLYFSTSPYGAYKELGTYNDLRISSFMLKDNHKLNIFENENKFEQLIIENVDFNSDFEKFTDNLLNEMINYDIIHDKNQLIQMFYLLILSSCCSFPKRNVTKDFKDTKFIEEYVLPQVLTIVLKEKSDCHGIKYTSTKSYVDFFKDEENEIRTILYSNYCIFTNYKYHDKTKLKDVYDRDLYKKFIISNPINFNDDINEYLYKIDPALNLINSINELDTISSHYKSSSIALGTSLKLLNKFNLTIDEKELVIKKFINLHIVFIRNILLNIKDFKEVNYE